MRARVPILTLIVPTSLTVNLTTLGAAGADITKQRLVAYFLFVEGKTTSGSSPCFSQVNPRSPKNVDFAMESPSISYLNLLGESPASLYAGSKSGIAIDEMNTPQGPSLGSYVNSYPTERGFTAIGTGGDDFVQAMVVAVESVIQQPIPQGQVRQKVSSGGKYVSVNIGPIHVVSSEQVQAVYNAMRRDDRMKYFL
nr:uncharacterized protein LOC112522985 isoform X2 [Ipomoea batatas]